MDALLSTIVAQAPNLLFAIYFIVRQQKTIDSLLDNQAKLIDRLLIYVDNDKKRADGVVVQRASLN